MMLLSASIRGTGPSGYVAVLPVQGSSRLSTGIEARGQFPTQLCARVRVGKVFTTPAQSLRLAGVRRRRRASVRVSAGIFERFTEKAIKAVMRAQNFAQRMSATEVSNQ